MSAQEAFSEEDLEAAIPRVRAFVGRRVADHAAADDITGKVLERALRYRHSFDGERELGGWLTGIAHNAVNDHFNAAKREVPTEDVPLVRDDDAEFAFERIETAESFDQMLSWLSARDDVTDEGLRVGVLALAGKNITETSTELGIHRETVRRHRSRLKVVLVDHPEIRRLLGLWHLDGPDR